MAQVPCTSASMASSYSTLYPMSNFQPPNGAIGVSPRATMSTTPPIAATRSDKAQQFGAMINEIERVRSRFDNERSQSDQFSQQMGMLAKQIESLTSQQTSMLGFHIGRMDSMLQELKNSRETLSKEEQRAHFENEERERRERLEREKLMHNERMERERKEFQERMENERRSNEERVRRESIQREREQTEEQKKVENQTSAVPSMNLSDIIPRPARTVTASKRKLSLDLSSAPPLSSSSSSALSSLAAATAAATGGSGEPANKRARTTPDTENAGDKDFQAMFQQFMEQKNQGGDPSKEQQTDDDQISAMSEAPTGSEGASSDLAPMDLGDGAQESLSDDIQEQLKNQAMAMLQAQLAAGESMPPVSNDLDLPPMNASSSSSNSMSHIKSEASSQPNAFPTQNSASVVKPEPTQAAPASVKPAPKSKPAAKKTKKAKAVTPAVEDTTIADPMSVPLKNKAIHQWMMKDPERLYTADDICKAGIRYRADRKGRRGTQKGKVYVIDDRLDVRKMLGDKANKGRLYSCERKENNQGLWRAIA